MPQNTKEYIDGLRAQLRGTGTNLGGQLAIEDPASLRPFTFVKQDGAPLATTQLSLNLPVSRLQSAFEGFDLLANRQLMDTTKMLADYQGMTITVQPKVRSGSWWGGRKRKHTRKCKQTRKATRKSTRKCANKRKSRKQ